MEIDLEKLVSNNLTLDGYLVLYCLYYKKEDVLLSYIKNTAKIPTKVFQDLVVKEFIDCESSETFTLNNMKLTGRFKELFVKEEEEVVKTPFDELFEELKNTYPNKVINLSTGEPRYLRQDLDRCEKLYRNIIVDKGVIDYELHKLIIQCIRYLVGIKTKSRSLGYMQMLPTFLQQKSWKAVVDDVKAELAKGKEIKQVEGESEGENKTQLGSKEF